MARTPTRDRPERPGRATTSQSRGARQRPLRDNPLLILLGIGLFLAALAGLVLVADRSTELARPTI